MAEYYGIIQSIIKRGYNAYQVTFRIHKIHGEETIRRADTLEDPNDVLVYRADIAIENDRSFLFPDHELGKCLKMYQSYSEEILPGIGWESQRNIGSLADSICRQMRELLLERQMSRQSRVWRAAI
ncbi:MAG: hypothetical protein WAO19_07425 [Candidatus Kryptoniota bacterium]